VPAASNPLVGAGSGWRKQLSTLISDTIRVFARHRGIATVAFANVPTGPNALALTDAMLELLAESGISRQARAWAVDVIALYVTAAGTEETIYLEKGAAGLRETEVVSHLQQSLAALSPNAYPNITDLRRELVHGSGDDRARWGIDVLINGILATEANPSDRPEP
jgi:Tetracyclin repressor-like, C-terminal domain